MQDKRVSLLYCDRFKVKNSDNETTATVHQPNTELGDNKCSGDSKRIEIEIKITVSCDSFTHTELLQPISKFPRL